MRFENSCRLCLKDLSDVLFDEDSHFSLAEDRSLQRMVLECFQIQVTDEESVTRVCDKCHYETSLVYKIRKRVRKADFQVKQYYACTMLDENVEFKEESLDNIQEDKNVDSVEFLSENDEYDKKPEMLASLEILPVDDIDHVDKQEYIEVIHLLDHEKPCDVDLAQENERVSVERKHKKTEADDGDCIDRHEYIKFSPLVEHGECSDENLAPESECIFVKRKRKETQTDNVDCVERREGIEVSPHVEHEECNDADWIPESKRTYTTVNRKRKKTQEKKLLFTDWNAVVRRKIDHRCYICASDFDSIEMLDNHLGTHVGSTPPICNLCDFHATTVRFLNMHLRTIHFRKGKRIPCEECKKNNTIREFSSKDKLQAHIKSVHEGIVEIVEKKFVCTYCGKAYSRSTGLRMHENIHTKAILHKCQQCSFAATSRSGLLRHLRIHTAEKPFKCDECDASFNQSNGLHSHKASKHNNERHFSCDICGEKKRFKTKYSLQSHMRLHEKSQKVMISNYTEGGSVIKTFGAEIPVYEPELKCSFCPAVYRKELFLCRHIIEKHPSENVDMIPCDTCNAANKNVFFLTQNEKGRHVDNHEKIKPIPDKERACPDCGEIFQTTVTYKRHRQKHVKNICKECGKTFATSQTLRLHLVTVHLKSRPYKCNKCELSFGQMTTLNAHMKVHQK